ncbi:MAG TPA: S9 family peptidase [Gaiellales bacterium]|jgi:dipeptidyl aminopeptidase/acylaminoacyl peptidase
MAASIEPFLRMRSAALVGHLPSGDLAYLSDQTGTLQLYVARSDGLHDQLTFGEERVTGALRSRSDERIVLTRDAGGNERHQISCLDARTGREHPLTDARDAIHSLGALAPDGSTLAFTHTGRNGTDFDLALVGLDGSGRRELVELEGMHAVCDWTEHGILLWRMRTPFDHDLYLVDPADGRLQHLTPHEHETSYESPRLLADGLVVCACDAGGQFTRLAIIAPGAEPQFRTPDDADVEHVRLDATRTHIAHVVNRGGPSELWLDGARVEGLPRGVYGSPEVAPDGRIALTVGALADTTDVWSAPGPVRLTRSATGGVPRDSLKEPVLHSFESFDGRRIPYLLYGEQGAPTVCFVHGGPESQYRGSLNPVVSYLVSRGIAVAAPNVRGSTGYGRDYHHLDDVELRLDSVRDLAELGKVLGAAHGAPVAVMGGSYGGYMTMAAITEHPELWSAAVNIVGIVNFVTFLERTGSYRRALREAEYGSLERDRAFLERISPIHKVDRIACPLMVVHGANDPRVPVSEAEQVVAALQERGREVHYLRYEDEGHGITRLRNRLDCYPQIAAFLERHLGLG